VHRHQPQRCWELKATKLLPKLLNVTTRPAHQFHAGDRRWREVLSAVGCAEKLSKKPARDGGAEDADKGVQCHAQIQKR